MPGPTKLDDRTVDRNRDFLSDIRWTHVVARVGQVRHLRSGAAEDYPAWPLESLFTREGSTALDLTLVEIHDNSIDHLRRYIELLFGVGAEQAHQLTD